MLNKNINQQTPNNNSRTNHSQNNSSELNSDLMTKTSLTKPLVILIHGLHQRGYVMRPLARRLRQQAYQTYTPSYYSLMHPIENHSKRINDWLSENEYPHNLPIHLVGHSLGGLVIRDFTNRYPQWTIGNSVTLGTPHMGSISADYVRRLLPPLVGHAYKNALDGTTPPLPDNINLGVIAGTKPAGLGQLFLNHYSRKHKLLREDAIHDGSVYLSETRLPNASDHIALPVTHTGMLFDKTVAKQVAYFLKHGQFSEDIL